MPRQSKIFEYIEQDVDSEVYVVSCELPAFLDIHKNELVERGPYSRGDEIRRGEVSDAVLRILLHHGWIYPKR